MAKKSNKGQLILLVIAVIASVVITAMVVSSIKGHAIAKISAERTKAETLISVLAKEKVTLSIANDSIVAEIKQKTAFIEYLEHNKTIIIQNNDKIHIDLDNLNAVNSIVKFTDNASNYESQRSRYGLHRFH